MSHSLLSNDQTGCDAVPVRVGHNKMARSFHAFCLEQFYRRRNRDFSAPKKNTRFLEARPATETLMGVALGLQEPIGVGINSMHRACFCPSVTKSETSLLEPRIASPLVKPLFLLNMSATLAIATIIMPGRSPGTLQICVRCG